MIGIPIQNLGCALYGGTSYTNDFLGINFLIILASFSIVAFVYMVTRFLPPNLSARITGVTRVEVVELVMSVVILMAVLAFALTACNISSSISTSVTGSGSSPLTFADQYIANLTFNTGLTLLTNIYGYSIAYQIDGSIWGQLSNLLLSISPSIGIPPTPPGFQLVNLGFPFGADLSILYTSLGNMLIGALAPLVITALGILFVQWLAIPVIQATAFVIVLPVAVAMRSFAYAAAGPGLRQAANTVLALAVAAYIVYPLAVSFDPVIISWLYGSPSALSGAYPAAGSNPAAPYLAPYVVASLSPGLFSSTGSSNYQAPGFSFQVPAIGSFLNTAFAFGLPALNPGAIFSQVQVLIDSVAQFIFTGVVLFAIDLGITFAFAMGLTAALNSGIEGEARFWSG